MDATDRLILNKIQSGFPVDYSPYKIIGHEIGISENEVWLRINELKKTLIIRRIGGIFDLRKLGYVSTLCAAKAPESKIAGLIELMQDTVEITHSYLRYHPVYNLWFTVIAKDPDRMDQVLSKVQSVLGSNQVYSLPAINTFKIGVFLALTKPSPGRLAEKNSVLPENPNSFKGAGPYTIREADKLLIRQLQEDIPNSLTPFIEIASRLGWDQSQVISKTRRLLTLGIMRRFGAILYHRKAGFKANAMGVWVIPGERVAEVGLKIAGFEEVSHCYERGTIPDWPYNLFTMVHGRSNEECERIMANISQAVGVGNYSILYSHTELKKTSMKYFTE
jgi:siroheme decarboxylase